MLCRYTGSLLQCPIPEKSEVNVVSLVVHDPCVKPLHILPVASHVIKPMRKFTVCVAPYHGQVPKRHILTEWIEFNRILGVEFFVFYTYRIKVADLTILQYYVNQGLAEIHPWKPLPKRRMHFYFAQMAAINDCVMRHRTNTEFIAIFDLDEFIIPRQDTDKTWADVFRRLPEASSYIFRTIFFPIRWKLVGKQKTLVNDLNNTTQSDFLTLRKLTAVRKIFPSKIRSKTIVNPRNIGIAGVHYVLSHTKGDGFTVDPDIALVHHYTRWPFDPSGVEVDIDTTVLKYETQLIRHVDRAVDDIESQGPEVNPQT